MEEGDLEQVIKDIALFEELETSVKLIKLGFGEIQNLDEANDFYFLPFQILSQGFERLMKCHICYGYFNLHKRYPDFHGIRKDGHDLEKLKKTIVANYFVTNESILAADKKFLIENNELKELLFILSEFGKKSRYHNFDIVTGNDKPSIDVRKLMQEFESKLLRANPKSIEKLTSIEFRYQVFEEQARFIIMTLEKFVAAISRQFIWNCIGSKARQFSSPLTSFNFLSEKELGVKDYRKNTTSYNNTQRKVHKRTIKDEFQRKFNPNFKSKKIRKSEYKGEWPFYADEVIIECRDNHWCIITINGKDYALNGSATGKYKLELPNEAGMTILGLDFSKFIKMALEL